MRIRLMLLFACLCLLLSGCAAEDPLHALSQRSAIPDAPVPAPVADDAVHAQQATVTLWFRFGQEPFLAPEERQITRSGSNPFELTLLQALISGPSADGAELNGLFPPGTQVLSTYRQDQLLFVTLSPQIMNAYADEPDNWATQPQWAQEVPLRRTLAMQSIAATITENCDVDQVIILVDQPSGASDSLRLRQRYYLTGGDDAALADALTRDETLLLSPQTTVQVILQCWSERDWPRLYRYVARTEPDTQESRPEEDAFLLLMDDMPRLTGFTFTGGNVNQQGTQATFTLETTFVADGRAHNTDGIVLRLCRERGIWRIPMSQLTMRKEAAP